MSYDLCFPNVRHYLQSQEVNVYEIDHEEKHIIFRQSGVFFFFLPGGVGAVWGTEGQFNQMGFDSPHYSPRYQIS